MSRRVAGSGPHSSPNQLVKTKASSLCILFALFAFGPGCSKPPAPPEGSASEPSAQSTPPPAGPETPIDIGSRRELFVDELLISKMDNVSLQLHEPLKLPPPEIPLPARGVVTVIKDDDLYRAWYRGSDPSYTGEKHSGNPGETVFYAESQDGHEWEFPNLGLHEIGGSLDNNVILANQPPLLHNFTPFLDTREGVDPSERYKAVAGYPGPGDKRGKAKPGIGLFGFVSPDGIHWTKQNEIIPYRPEWRHAFDSQNVAFWSEAEQLYVCYFRTWTRPEKLRSVARSTSPDFVHWSEPTEMAPNLPGEHLYKTVTQPYLRAPHIYIALPTRFVPGEKDSAEEVRSNATDILFMSSRAGSSHYDRPFLEAFIRPGLDPKSWTNRANYVANNVIQTGPEELSIYHRNGNRYTLRPDGFISVHAGFEEGSLLTKPLIFQGDKLELNYSTGARGRIQVEILSEEGSVLATSEELVGDAIDFTVPWQDGAALSALSALSGQPLRLRFTLKEADLYAMRFLNQSDSSK